MGTSVKIMLSYDYCHFEVSKSTDQDLTNKEINEMRKEVQRLADEAVRQFKVAKEKAANRTNANLEMQNFEITCKRIAEKNEADRTLKEIAMLKQYQDENWRARFNYEYDYDDDSEEYR